MNEAICQDTQDQARANQALAVWRFGWLALWCLLVHFTYRACRLSIRLTTDAYPTRLRLAQLGMKIWLAGCSRIAGVQVESVGRLPTGPAILAPNHTSYLDMLLGSVCPTTLLLKQEPFDWPMIGSIIKGWEQLGIKRQAGKVGKAEKLRVISELAKCLEVGATVSVFFEGTRSSGEKVGKLHPSLMQVNIEMGAPIVPVAIVCNNDHYHYSGQHFGRHFWKILGLSGIKVTIVFGDPIMPHGFTVSELATRVHERIVALLKQAKTLRQAAEE